MYKYNFSRYEGIDQRFINECIDLEISIGDYVLSSGELPLLLLIDSLVRLLPNAIGNQNEFIMTPLILFY